jgi:dinuclear metal center YbgI/SA1388 family protein
MATLIVDILAEVDQLLQPSRFEDYGPNGLQVPGPHEIATIVTGVSAHVELFERARAQSADLILVHHGLFWGSGIGSIDVTMKRRLKLLFDADIALAAYHLPLDAHPEIGNNALIARALGATELQPFAMHKGQPIGCIATLQGNGIDADGPNGLFAAVKQLTGQQPLVLANGPETVHTIAIVTGAGTDYLQEAVTAGADAFITGEPAERAMALAAEGGIHFVAAGHHATETFGIRRLGERLQQEFSLKHVFIDVKNPI